MFTLNWLANAMEHFQHKFNEMQCTIPVYHDRCIPWISYATGCAHRFIFWRGCVPPFLADLRREARRRLGAILDNIGGRFNSLRCQKWRTNIPDSVCFRGAMSTFFYAVHATGVETPHFTDLEWHSQSNLSIRTHWQQDRTCHIYRRVKTGKHRTHPFFDNLGHPATWSIMTLLLVPVDAVLQD